MFGAELDGDDDCDEVGFAVTVEQKSKETQIELICGDVIGANGDCL